MKSAHEKNVKGFDHEQQSSFFNYIIVAVILSLFTVFIHNGGLTKKWSLDFDRFSDETNRRRNKELFKANQNELHEHFTDKSEITAETPLVSDHDIKTLIQDLSKKFAANPTSSENEENEKKKPSIDYQVEDLMYTHPDNPFARGRPFEGLQNETYKKIFIEYLQSPETTLDPSNPPVPQAVTAISEDHFLESNLTLQTFFKSWPGHKVQLWDLGLSEDQVKYVKGKPELYILVR